MGPGKASQPWAASCVNISRQQAAAGVRSSRGGQQQQGRAACGGIHYCYCCRVIGDSGRAGFKQQKCHRNRAQVQERSGSWKAALNCRRWELEGWQTQRGPSRQQTTKATSARDVCSECIFVHYMHSLLSPLLQSPACMTTTPEVSDCTTSCATKKNAPHKEMHPLCLCCRH